MHQFKTASRSLDEMKLATDKVTEAFDKVKGANGRLDRAGVKALADLEVNIGEILVELADDQVLFTDPTPFFVETRDAGLMDDFIFQEISAALRVVDYAHTSRPQSTRVSFSEFSMKTSAHEIVMEVPLIHIASGRYNPAMISGMMADAITRDRVSRILAGIDAGIPSVADHSGLAGYTLRYTGLTEANLKKAVHGLYDEGLQPTIFGRWSALLGIADFPGWTTASDAAIREFETRGMVGSYIGAPLVTLRDNFSKKIGTHMLPNDRVWLASGIKGAIHLRRDLSFLNFSEVRVAEAVYRVGIRFEDGLLVHDPYQYRLITV
jgi:hypothetical protein